MLLRLAILPLALLLGLQTSPRPPVPIDLKGASSDEHIWFAAADLKEPHVIRLYHHAVGMDGPYYRTPTELPSMPSAIAAEGASAWLVFDPPPNQAKAQRDVYTIRAERSPATGIYFYIPDKVPKLVEPLPAEGALVGFAAGPDGPLALLAPYAWTEAGVEAGEGRGMESTLTSPRLLALRGGKWIDLVPPPLATGDRPVGLLVIQPSGEVMVMAQRRSGARQMPVIFRRHADDSWSAIPTSLSARRLASPQVQGSRPLLVMAAEAGAEVSAGLRVGFLRGGGFIPLGTVPAGKDALLVAGTERDIRIIRATRGGELQFQRLDTITGRLSEPQTMAGQPLSTASRVYFPLLVTVFTIALLLAILVRPAATGFEKKGPAVELAPFGSRGLALLADLAPAGMAAVFLTRGEFSDLLNFPLWATTMEESAAIMATALITGIHCAVSEALWSTSFGKAIAGLRVEAIGGGRARLWQSVVRNVFKVVCIIMPPLAVFALLNPSRQSLGDAVARTIVTTVPQKGEPPAQEVDSGGPNPPRES